MGSSKGIRIAQSRETRALLMGVARNLFSTKGFHAAGTNEIVALAGVTRGALYHHFSSKEELFVAVFIAVQQDLSAAIRALWKQSGNESGIYGWDYFRACTTWYMEAAMNPEVQRIMLLDAPTVLGWEEWRRLQSDYGVRIIEGALVDGMRRNLVRKQHPGILAQLIMSLIDEAARMIANGDNHQDVVHGVEAALDTLLSSLD